MKAGVLNEASRLRSERHAEDRRKNSSEAEKASRRLFVVKARRTFPVRGVIVLMEQSHIVHWNTSLTASPEWSSRIPPAFDSAVGYAMDSEASLWGIPSQYLHHRESHGYRCR